MASNRLQMLFTQDEINRLSIRERQTMANTKQVSKQNSQEETNMKKFIVEAPEPKKGQTISSGGIRENGKIMVQYKNPRPYEEPALPPMATNRSVRTDLMLKEQARARRNEAGMYLLGIIWQELGEPLLRSGLNRLEEKIISLIDGSAKPEHKQVPVNEPEIIDVEADEIQPVCDE